MTEDDVANVIYSLKNGKAPDIAGISSEHLKYGGPLVVTVLIQLINLIFESFSLPELFKLFLVSPIFKNKGKPIMDPNSYRKITVSSIINKVMENLHLDNNADNIIENQSPLQRLREASQLVSHNFWQRLL